MVWWPLTRPDPGPAPVSRPPDQTLDLPRSHDHLTRSWIWPYLVMPFSPRKRMLEKPLLVPVV